MKRGKYSMTIGTIGNQIEYHNSIDKEKRRGIIRAMMPSKGYGFIEDAKTGKSIYFHAMGAVRPLYDDMREGMEVEYMVTEDGRGVRAIGVKEIGQPTSHKGGNV